LEVVILINFVESEITLKGSIWSSIPAVQRFSIMLTLPRQNGCGGIDRWNGFGIINILSVFFCF